MAWWVYLVRCRDGSLYAGCAVDVPARVERHNKGQGARYTRSRRPVRLVFSRRVKDRSSALRSELALKRLTRDEKLALVAKGKAARLPRFVPKAARAQRR